MTIKIVNKAVLVLLALTLAAGGTVNAMPAKRGNIKYTMPDGNTITVQIHGDERHHYFTTTDGYVVLRGERDVFTYALPVGGVLVDSKIKASDADSRTPDVASVLRGIDREECVNIMNKVRKSKARRTAARVAPESENMTFPTKGSPRLLAVLVEFTDKKFSLPDPYNTFSRYLSENGYHDFGSTGS